MERKLRLGSAQPSNSGYVGTAILLIDMQPYFTRRVSNIETIEVPNMLRVLEHAGENKIPVVVLEYEGNGSTIGALKAKVDALPTSKAYVSKSYDNGFANTDLRYRLRCMGTTEVVLMGINASACVKATATGALNKGFGILTSLDLIADSYYCGNLDHRSGDWYRKHGRVAQDHHDLLGFIDKKRERRKQGNSR